MHAAADPKPAVVHRRAGPCLAATVAAPQSWAAPVRRHGHTSGMWPAGPPSSYRGVLSFCIVDSRSESVASLIPTTSTRPFGLALMDRSTLPPPWGGPPRPSPNRPLTDGKLRRRRFWDLLVEGQVVALQPGYKGTANAVLNRLFFGKSRHVGDVGHHVTGRGARAQPNDKRFALGDRIANK
jgi:hypothetical protein